MKRIYTYILMIVCATMFAGCQKDFDGVLTAEIEGYQGNDGKVFLDDDNFACWDDGDLVHLNDYDEAVTFNGDKAEIRMKNGQTGPYYASFPHKSIHQPRYDHNVVFNKWLQFDMIADEALYYKYRTNNAGKQIVNAPMVAYAEDAQQPLAFKNVGSLIKVNLTNNTGGDMKLYSIKLIATTEGAVLRRWISVDSKTMTFKDAYDHTPKTSNSATMVFANNVTGGLSIAAGSTGVYYIPILPVNSAFTVEVVYTNPDGTIMKFIKEGTTPNDIQRSKLVNMPLEVGVGAEYQLTSHEGGGYDISSALDMFLVAQKCNNGHDFSGEILYLNNDITLFAFDGIGTKTAPFCGRFEGQQNTIYNGSEESPSTSGIFNVVSNGAYIYGLNVDSYIKRPDKGVCIGGIVNDIRGDGEVQIRYCNSSGSIEGNTIGGICGQNTNTNSGTIIYECSNDATMKTSNNAGGILGRSMNNKNSPCSFIKIEECINNGLIHGEGTCSGGIVGSVLDCGVLLEKCRNYGDVKEGVTMGGLIGDANGKSEDGKYVTIRNCQNQGDVFNHYADIFFSPCGGGLVGDGCDLIIENSCSLGAVTGDGVRADIIGRAGYIIKLDNVYTVGKSNGNKRIIGGIMPNKSISSLECNHVYSPDVNNFGEGISITSGNGVTKYTVEEDPHHPYQYSRMKVNGKELVVVLDENKDAHNTSGSQWSGWENTPLTINGVTIESPRLIMWTV